MTITNKLSNKVDIKTLLKLTIPIFLELIFQVLLGNVDKIMVRNDASANAINQANSILDMLTISISMLAAGSLILIGIGLSGNQGITSGSFCFLCVAIVFIKFCSSIAL